MARIQGTVQATLDAVARNETLESFTITIDPAGSDVADARSVYDQASATAHGAFATMHGAAQALPDGIRHNVIFSHVDGQHDPTSYELFGNLARFSFGTADLDDFPNGWGRFTVTSASGRVRVGGTSAMAVASAADGTQFTLAADPGFAADLYAGYHVRVVSGTGAGQVKAVRYHTGTAWKVAGRFSPSLNGTSVVEVVQAAAWINMDATFYGLVQGFHAPTGQQVECLHLEEIDLISTNANVGLDITGLSVAFTKCRLRRVNVATVNAFMTVDQGIFDGEDVAGSFALVGVRGGYFRAWSSSSSWLIRRGASHGLRLYGGTQSALQMSTAHFFEGAIDENAGSGLVVEGPGASAFNATRPYGTGNAAYGVRVLNGGYYYPRLSDFASGSEYLRGDLGEVNVDGTVKTYAQVDAVTDNTIIGIHNSVVNGNQPVTP